MDPPTIPVHQLLSLQTFLLLKVVKNRIPTILDDTKEIHDFDYEYQKPSVMTKIVIHSKKAQHHTSDRSLISQYNPFYWFLDDLKAAQARIVVEVQL